MKFRATVRKPSELHSRWERELRTGGMVSGVQFRKVNGVYVSVDDSLPPGAVADLSVNNMIRLELSADPAPPAPPAAPASPIAQPVAPIAPPVPPVPKARKVDLRAPQKGWPVGKG